MASKLRYGPRWSGGRVEDTDVHEVAKSPWFKSEGGFSWDLTQRHPRSLRVRISSAQKTSLANHKKKGIVPSMPQYKCLAGAPERVDPVTSILRAAEKAVWGSAAEGIICNQGGCAIVSVKRDGKRHTVCVDTETHEIQWVEGP